MAFVIDLGTDLEQELNKYSKKMKIPKVSICRFAIKEFMENASQMDK